MRVNTLRLWPLLAVAGAFALTACPDKPAEQASTDTGNQPAADAPLPPAPAFNADSAYAYTARQVAFGPRVPNSKAHVACGNYLVGTLKRFGLKVMEQPFTAKTFDGVTIRGRNIVAQYQPQAVRRVAVFAHWDTRPFADEDKGANHNKPIDGASDGASAVATALEIIRQLSLLPADKAPAVGVDVILFDAEDWGHDDSTQADVPNQTPAGQDSWCLGSQYWSKNKMPAGYQAEYGILLDMVGAKDGHFTREGTSLQNARSVVDKIWSTADKLGYSNLFSYTDTGAITDDHVYTNQAGIPTVDIYDHPPYGQNYFPAYHHTVADNMPIIDRKTMKAVGQTVLQVLVME